MIRNPFLPKLGGLFFLGLLLFTCQASGEADPGPVIPEAELVQIIPEILLIDPAIREVAEVAQDSLARKYYQRILEPRGYTLSDFVQSMQWLQQDPKRMQKVYEQVLDGTTTLETELRD